MRALGDKHTAPLLLALLLGKGLSASRLIMTLVGHRILIVDANVDAATRLSLHLQRHGCEVATAPTLESAVPIASVLGPKVVMVDDQFGVSRLRSLRGVLLGTEACDHTTKFVCLVRTQAAAQVMLLTDFDAAFANPVGADDLVAYMTEALVTSASRAGSQI